MASTRIEVDHKLSKAAAWLRTGRDGLDVPPRSSSWADHGTRSRDVALYASRIAKGFGLGRYAAIRAWLGRVAAQPGHVRIDKFEAFHSPRSEAVVEPLEEPRSPSPPRRIPSRAESSGGGGSARPKHRKLTYLYVLVTPERGPAVGVM